MCRGLDVVMRQPREEVEGGIYHVFARGNGRGRIFLDDVDRHRYLRLLGETVIRQHWYALAYCLMDNHVHLLLETPQANLAQGMQRLHGRYAQRFNHRHDHVGHVFQGRYGCVRVTSDAQMWTVTAYIAANPVGAGRARRPDEWRWSSYRATLAGSGPVWLSAARLLDHFGARGGEPVLRYRQAVSARAAAPAPR
jgi:putative transposase